MKIAVVGLGVAGSYLAARLASETNHEVYGFEMLPFADSKCAWGASRHELSRLMKPFDIDFSGYVLYEGKRVNVVFPDQTTLTIPTVGLVTFDKNRLEEDLVALAQKGGAKIFRGRKVVLGELSGFDLVVDASGVYRSLLPKIEGDLIFPNIEHRVLYDGPTPFDDFTVIPYPGLTGYTWFFPLGPNVAHVGGGDRLRRQKQFVEQFMAKYGGKVVRTIGRPIRLLPFGRTGPVYVRLNGKTVVGVGEAIGTVFPLLGEGIIPSFQSAEALFGSISPTGVDLEGYVRALKKRFFYFEPIYRAIVAKWSGKWSPLSLTPGFIYAYFKSRRIEQRFGIKVRISDFVKIFRKT